MKRAWLIGVAVLPLAAQGANLDGKQLFHQKCAMCHGPEGQGKVGPALKGISLSADQITDLLTKGDDAKKAPHKKAVSGVAADDAKAVAEYVKSLK